MPTPRDDRTEPPLLGDEQTLLEGFLDFHRQTLLWKSAGLTGHQARERSVPPSPLSLHGLVRHLADVERSWFRERFAGQQVGPMFHSPANPDGDFFDTAEADFAADVATYRSEVEAVKAALRDHSLEDTFVLRGKTFSLRWVYLHMIEEYARHNGHADLIRERIDGATGE
jgi:hypothetical protein